MSLVFPGTFHRYLGYTLLLKTFQCQTNLFCNSFDLALIYIRDQLFSREADRKEVKKGEKEQREGATTFLSLPPVRKEERKNGRGGGRGWSCFPPPSTPSWSK